MKWYFVVLIVAVVAVASFYAGKNQGKKLALAGTTTAPAV